ncbi:MAG: GlsB/YeaQ/YmgE family stress response membrane protein [Chloroflexi bacterium]|nr:GlsB/YeaQ/YmgE family stress response membrane protein [Chloroflexota bacterium]
MGAGVGMNILLGLVGGVLGSLLLRVLNLQGIESIWLVGNIITGVIGAVVVIAVARLFGDKSFGR